MQRARRAWSAVRHEAYLSRKDAKMKWRVQPAEYPDHSEGRPYCLTSDSGDGAPFGDTCAITLSESKGMVTASAVNAAVMADPKLMRKSLISPHVSGGMDRDDTPISRGLSV